MAGQWRLRGYVVERLLGSGASADVWRARVAATGDPVALKRISVGDPAQAGRARQEAALLSALEHPNLIRLHALVPAEDSLVLVLDLADGGSLRDVLEARGRLTPGEVVTAIAPVAAAVSYLHSEAVVHGDVSAANILFTDAGVPLLCDVGVARLTGDERDAEGTPSYIDPAVAAGSVPGPPSDVFSLGAVAFHALTGSPLWSAATAEQTLALAARGVPEDVADRLRATDTPDAVSAAVLRALASDPHRRGTPVELALDLRQGTTPLAVEFRAGRARVEPTLPDRTASLPENVDGHAEQDHAPGRHAAAGSRGAPGRPVFERPGPVRAAPGTEPPTRMVGPRPRPTIPRPAARRHRVAFRLNGRLVLVGSAVVAVICAVAVLVYPGAWGAGAPAAAPGHPPASSSAAAQPSSAPDPSAGGSGLSRWARALEDLDAVRAEAYATRAPELLAQVYLPGSLLEDDQAQLRRLVPAGCGLTGALTAYRVLRVGPGTAHPVVTALAYLPATRLVCSGTVRAGANPSERTRLQIELTDTPHGLRISAEHRT